MKHLQALAVSLALILLPIFSQVLGQENISLSESYTSAYYQLTFDYPSGWDVIDQPAGPMLLNYEYNNSQPYETGHARLQIWPPQMLHGLRERGRDVDTSGSVELLDSLRPIFDSGDREKMGVAKVIEFGGVEGARADGTFLGNPTIFLAVCAQKDECIMIFGDTHEGEFADSENLFLQVAASVSYKAAQFSTELATINSSNAEDITRFKSLRWLDRRTGQTEQVALSPDGTWAVSALGSDGVKLWDIETGALAHHFEDVEANQIAFLPDSKQLVTVYPFEESLQVIDVTSQEVLRFPVEDKLGAVDISPDGETIVTGSWSGKVQLWDAKSYGIIKTLGETIDDRINAVAISESHIAATHEKGNAALYSLNNPDSAHLLPIGEGVAYALAFSGDGTRLAVVTSSNQYLVFDVASAKQILSGSGADDFTSSALLNQDGSLLVLTTDDDQFIRFIDVAKGKTLAELRQGGDHVSALAFSADEKLLLAGGLYDETLILWAVP